MSTLSWHDSSNLLLLSALCILFHILEYVLSFDKVLHHGIEVTILSTFDLLALRFRVHRKHYFLDWMCSLLSIVEEAGTRVVWFWSFPYLVLCLSSKLLLDLITLSRHRTYRTCVRQYVWSVQMFVKKTQISVLISYMCLFNLLTQPILLVKHISVLHSVWWRPSNRPDLHFTSSPCHMNRRVNVCHVTRHFINFLLMDNTLVLHF